MWNPSLNLLQIFSVSFGEMISWPWFPTSFRNQVWRCKSIQIQIRRRRVFLFRKLISNQSTVLNGDLEGLETWWEKKFVKARWKTWTQKLRRFGCLGGLETWWEKKSWKQCGRLKRKNCVKINDSGGLEHLLSKKFGKFYWFVYTFKLGWQEQILREINYFGGLKDLVSKFFVKSML